MLKISSPNTYLGQWTKGFAMSVIWILGAVTPFFAIAQPASNLVIDEIVAKVDNQIVLKSEVEYGYLQAASEGELVDRCQVLESLLINKMLLAKADIDSVTVPEAQVNEELDGRMNYLVSSLGGDKDRIEKQYGKTIEQLKEELRLQVQEQLIMQKMQQRITADIKITPAQVRRFFNKIPYDSLPYYSTEVEVAQLVISPQA